MVLLFEKCFRTRKVCTCINSKFIVLVAGQTLLNCEGLQTHISKTTSTFKVIAKKVITKDISNRLKEVNPTVILGNQNAFVKRKEMHDQVLVLNECLKH